MSSNWGSGSFGSDLVKDTDAPPSLAPICQMNAGNKFDGPVFETFKRIVPRLIRPGDCGGARA